jgi:hypothetical protein
MSSSITTELVVAYYQCRRKAFLILQGKVGGIKHEYEQILKARSEVNRSTYLKSLENSLSIIGTNQLPMNSEKSRGILSYENLEANCDALVQPKRHALKEHLPYEPHIVVGTSSVYTEQKISLAFAGHVAGKMRRYHSLMGIIIPFHGKPHKVGLVTFYPKIETYLNELRLLVNAEDLQIPPPILNEHCNTCSFVNTVLKMQSRRTISVFWIG